MSNSESTLTLHLDKVLKFDKLTEAHYHLDCCRWTVERI